MNCCAQRTKTCSSSAAPLQCSHVCVARRLVLERDSVERESREKETRILNLTRELEDLRDRVEEADRLRQQQARELEDIMSSKDDVGKNVSC